MICNCFLYAPRPVTPLPPRVLFWMPTANNCAHSHAHALMAEVGGEEADWLNAVCAVCDDVEKIAAPALSIPLPSSSTDRKAGEQILSAGDRMASALRPKRRRLPTYMKMAAGTLTSAAAPAIFSDSTSNSNPYKQCRAMRMGVTSLDEAFTAGAHIL